MNQSERYQLRHPGEGRCSNTIRYVLASGEADAVGFKFALDTSMIEDPVDTTSFVWYTGVQK